MPNRPSLGRSQYRATIEAAKESAKKQGVILCGAPGMSKAMSKAERKLGEYDDLMEDARMAGKESTRADAHDEDATSA